MALNKFYLLTYLLAYLLTFYCRNGLDTKQQQVRHWQLATELFNAVDMHRALSFWCFQHCDGSVSIEGVYDPSTVRRRQRERERERESWYEHVYSPGARFSKLLRKILGKWPNYEHLWKRKSYEKVTKNLGRSYENLKKFWKSGPRTVD